MSNRSVALLAFAATVATGTLPAQRLLREAFGPPNADFAARLAPAPDVDGDGVREVAIGLPGFDIGPLTDFGAGQVWNPRTGQVHVQAVGTLPNARFGTRVACPGDIDGNGTPDLVLAAPLAGNQAGIVVAPGPNGVPLWTATGAQPSRFGSALCVVGDIDGDGRNDLMIGTPGNSQSSPFGFVGAYRSSNGQPLTQFVGVSQSETGAALVPMGDVDGDGIVDVAVGEPQLGALYVGTVSMIRSQLGGGLAQIWSVTPAVSNSFAGRSLGNAGDLSGDGKADVLTPTRSGSILVLSGASGATLHQITDPDVDETCPITGIGDQNDDGLPEFAVGKPAFNNQAGRVTVYDGASRTVLYHLDGQAASLFGLGLVALGDVDGDGRGEFAAGAPRHMVGGQLVGRIAVHGITVNAQSTTFGTACGGSAGPLDLLPIGTARPGQACGGRVYNLPPNSLGLWLYGVSTTTSIYGPLPLDLGLVLGATGCSLLQSSEAQAPLLNGSNPYLNSQLALPSTQAIVGLRFHLQAALLDATHPGGLATSNAVTHRIGNQ